MPHFAIEKSGLFELSPLCEGSAWLHVLTGLHHAPVCANPPVNRWPLKAESKNIAS
jgi:hypothetical protein